MILFSIIETLLLLGAMISFLGFWWGVIHIILGAAGDPGKIHIGGWQSATSLKRQNDVAQAMRNREETTPEGKSANYWAKRLTFCMIMLLIVLGIDFATSKALGVAFKFAS